jgi:glycosyltransferase involved in cell wall biosynthesis
MFCSPQELLQLSVPLVSVKIITYNHAPFIALAIEGVLQQNTNFHFELVIGEDYSTDGTRKIVFEYQKKYPDFIRVITSEENVGMKKNGYRTTKACRGKYIAFCDGDDYWHRPDKLQKQIDYLENHPECGMLYSDFDIYYPKSKKRIENYMQYRKWVMPENLRMTDFLEAKKFWGVLTCTAVVRKSLVDQVYDADPYLYQNPQFMRGDMQLWAEISTKAGAHFMSESLATYNQTEESATRSKDLTKSYRMQIADAELSLYLCKKYNLSKNLREEIEAMKCNGMLKLAFHLQCADMAEEAWRKKEVLTLKEWLLYYGAKNQALYHPLRLAVLYRNIFRKARNEWL